MSDESDITLRPGRISDAADLAILDNIAGHGFSLWFWQGAVKMGKADDAYDFGRARMADWRAPFGWSNAVMACRGEEPLGAAVSYLMKPMDPNDEKLNPEPFVPVFELFGEAVGDWIVDSLAVYQSARGQGVGALLLDDCFAKAKAGGVKRISLVAEAENEPAISLYASRGLRERARRRFIPFKDGQTTQHWLLLSADIDGD